MRLNIFAPFPPNLKSNLKAKTNKSRSVKKIKEVIQNLLEVLPKCNENLSRGQNLDNVSTTSFLNQKRKNATLLEFILKTMKIRSCDLEYRSSSFVQHFTRNAENSFIISLQIQL